MPAEAGAEATAGDGGGGAVAAGDARRGASRRASSSSRMRCENFWNIWSLDVLDHAPPHLRQDAR